MSLLGILTYWLEGTIVLWSLSTLPLIWVKWMEYGSHTFYYGNGW